MENRERIEFNSNQKGSVQNVVSHSLSMTRDRGEHSFEVNPAGLAPTSRDYKSTSVSFYYSGILNNSGIDDLFYRHISIVQNSSEKIGRFAFSNSQFGLGGKNVFDDTLGQVVTINDNIIDSYSLYWAKQFNDKHSIGLAINFLNGGEIFEFFNERPYGFTTNIGYNYNFLEFFNYGLSLANIGLPLKGVVPFYEVRQDEVAVASIASYEHNENYLFNPLVMSSGLSFFYDYPHKNLNLFFNAIAFGIEKEFNTGYWGNMDNLIYSTSTEFIVLNTLVTYYGITINNRYNYTDFLVGSGLRLFNLLKISVIPYSTENNKLGSIQRGISIVLFNLLDWNKKDIVWWRK